MKDREEIIEMFAEFLNEHFKYTEFVEWLKERGENPEDFGFEEDED